ncbi:hypothetical protein ACFTWH_01765 [Streptomyces sp. NPDC057011]|uniref:hypothetical protein n=1 Tax=unclassified Streptomyces TaxID=2593676 RepID=UPI003630FC93
MITEPELDGGWESERPAEVAEPGEGPPGRSPARRPWLWALGGALAASAVWAGALAPAAQDRFTAAPRISYRHVEELCKSTPLKALTAVAGPLEERLARHEEGPALDWATCDFSGEWDGSRLAFYGRVEVELHKKTDPGPEFGAGLGLDPFIGPEVDEVHEVPGMGDRALLHGYMSASRLQVLDGGAVLTLTVQWHGEDGQAKADEDAVAAAVIEDMRALLAALKK